MNHKNVPGLLFLPTNQFLYVCIHCDPLQGMRHKIRYHIHHLSIENFEESLYELLVQIWHQLFPLLYHILKVSKDRYSRMQFVFTPSMLLPGFFFVFLFFLIVYLLDISAYLVSFFVYNVKKNDKST